MANVIPPRSGDFGWDYKGCPHTGGGVAWSGAPRELMHAVVWTGAKSLEGLHYLRSSDQGRSWSVPHRVGSPQGRRADIAASDQGAIAIAWDQLEGSGRVVYTMVSRDGGQRWLKPTRVSSERGDALYPRVMATRAGFLIAWTESESGGRVMLSTHVLPVSTQ